MNAATIGFFIGLFCGVFFGMLMMGLMVASGNRSRCEGCRAKKQREKD